MSGKFHKKAIGEFFLCPARCRATPAASAMKILDEIFSVLVQPHLVQPTFVMDYPVEMSPLAKKHRTTDGLVERFELFVMGKEIANAFSELNDPLDQRARLEDQATIRAAGDDEAMIVDDDFLHASEVGLPPTAIRIFFAL